MFIGQYSNKIDDKGRLAIPSKFRSDLTGGAIVTKGLDGCLFVYTRQDWLSLADRLTTLPLSAANARAFARQLLAGAMDVDIDKQGRIVLPAYLRQFAKLKSSVIVAGVHNRFEIWDESAWHEYQTKIESEANQIAEELGF